MSDAGLTRDGTCFWQLGDGFRFEVAVEPWPVRRDRPILLMFPNGPPLKYIRCFLVGDPEFARDPERGCSTLNLAQELPLVEVTPKSLNSTVVQVSVPLDRDEVTLAFEVGWERGGYAPSKEESWTCTPFRLRFAAPDAPDPDPFRW